jgi:hypothetical protein
VGGLTAFDVSTGKEKLFFTSNQYQFASPQWLPDSDGLLVLFAKPLGHASNQAGFVAFPDGEFHPVTRDTASYTDLSLAGDGRTLAMIIQQGHRDLFVTNGKDSPLTQVTSGAQLLDFAPAPDGRVIIQSQSGLSWRNLASQAIEPISTGEASGPQDPSACSDGRYIVFSARSPENTTNIWRLNAAGSELKKLTFGQNDVAPVCSSNARLIFYISGNSQGETIMRVPIEGGDAQAVTNLVVISNAAISPDGKLAAFITIGGESHPADLLGLAGTQPGSIAKTVPLQMPHLRNLAFSPDAKAVVYVSPTPDGDTLWLQPLDGSPGKAIANLKGQQIFRFGWTLDGKQLMLVAGHEDSDVVLLRDAEP